MVFTFAACDDGSTDNGSPPSGQDGASIRFTFTNSSPIDVVHLNIEDNISDARLFNGAFEVKSGETRELTVNGFSVDNDGLRWFYMSFRYADDWLSTGGGDGVGDTFSYTFRRYDL